MQMSEISSCFKETQVGFEYFSFIIAIKLKYDIKCNTMQLYSGIGKVSIIVYYVYFRFNVLQLTLLNQ